jgi:hypothetical protein
LAASAVAASAVRISSGFLERGPQHPIDAIALIPQRTEFEHRGAVADFFHLRAAQVVLEFRMPDQHDGKLHAGRTGELLDEMRAAGLPT